MKKDTFLSIDLDYWRSVSPSMISFLRKTLKLDVPKILVKHHHQLLPFINRNPAEVLVNIDYHSDLSEDDFGNPPELNCGTWVNHVRWREDSSFIWVCPSKKRCYRDGEGRCDSSRDSSTDPFKNDNNGWGSTKVKVGLHHVNLNKVIAIGYTLSPDYINWNFEVSKRMVAGVLPQIPSIWYKHDQTVDRRVFAF